MIGNRESPFERIIACSALEINIGSFMTTSSFTAISSLGFCAMDCSIADGQADSLTDGPTEWMSDCWQSACLPACLGDCFGWLLLCISIKHSLHYIYNGHKLCSPDAAINRSNGTTPSGTELKGSWGWADKLQWAIRWKREQAWTTVRHAEGVCSRELLDSH